MVTPDRIKEIALKKYSEYLKCKYSDDGKNFFPLIIRCNKKLDSDNIDDDITQLYNCSKLSKGYGYEWDRSKEKVVNSKRYSNQNIPGEIFFATEYDYLRYIGKIKKEGDITDFERLIQKILPEFPELKVCMVEKHERMVKYDGNWDDILKVCRFFRLNHKPDMFVRELPIGVHTKFIEQNIKVLSPLLDVIVGDDINKEAKTFFGRFNIKEGEPEVCFRILDKDISNKYFSSLTYIKAYINEFARLNIPLENVIIVENKCNTDKIIRILPNKKSTIVIWGSGYAVTVLRDVPWLKDLKLYYWGDIDAQGYEILSDIRHYFPYIESIMMDEEALRIHPTKVTGTVSKVKKQLALHDYENKVYEYVKENNLRCEQEFLPESFIKDKIKQSVKSFVS